MANKTKQKEEHLLTPQELLEKRVDAMMSLEPQHLRPAESQVEPKSDPEPEPEPKSEPATKAEPEVITEPEPQVAAALVPLAPTEPLSAPELPKGMELDEAPVESPTEPEEPAEPEEPTEPAEPAASNEPRPKAAKSAAKVIDGIKINPISLDTSKTAAAINDIVKHESDTAIAAEDAAANTLDPEFAPEMLEPAEREGHPIFWFMIAVLVILAAISFMLIYNPNAHFPRLFK